MSDILKKEELDNHVKTLTWYDQNEPQSQSFLIYKQSFLQKLKKWNQPYRLLLVDKPTKNLQKWILENDLDYQVKEGPYWLKVPEIWVYQMTMEENCEIFLCNPKVYQNCGIVQEIRALCLSKITAELHYFPKDLYAIITSYVFI
jgi:hypothetical protein